LIRDEIKHEVSQPLKAKSHVAKFQPNRPIVVLQSVENDIKKLSANGGDRIAGNLPILDLFVSRDRVELLVEFDRDNLI